MREHKCIYTILVMDIKEKKMEAVEVNHCIICGKERE